MFQITDANGSIRSTQVPPSLVDSSILDTWAGTVYITTIGTITTGTWNASPIAWAKINKSGAQASDINAEADLGKPGVTGYVLSSTDAGVRSWVAREPALGNPGVSGYLLSSTAEGVRSWVVPGEPALGNPDVSGKLLSSTDAGVRSWVAAGEPDLGNPATTGYVLSSTTVGIRSWVAREPALGNPAADGYVLSSTTGGVRSWVAPGSPTITDDTTTNASKYLVWVGGTGAQSLYISTTKIFFNPSTGLLTTALATVTSGSTSSGALTLLTLTHKGAAVNDNPAIEMLCGAAFGTKIATIFPGSSKAELAFYTGNTGGAATESMRLSGGAKLGLRTTAPLRNLDINKPSGGSSIDDPQIGFLLNGTAKWVMGVDDADADKFKVGYNPTTPFYLGQATIVLTLTQSGGAEVAGTLLVSSLGAFVADDKYVVVDSSGNFHKSALGPAS